VRPTFPPTANRPSREPSRSPNRASFDAMRGSPAQDNGVGGASSSRHPSTPPSHNANTSHPPTITEEASNVVGRSIRENGSSSANGNGNGSNGASRSKTRMRMVGDWQLQKTLGAGSMGKVKLATNVITKEKVCGFLDRRTSSSLSSARSRSFPVIPNLRAERSLDRLKKPKSSVKRMNRKRSVQSVRLPSRSCSITLTSVE